MRHHNQVGLTLIRHTKMQTLLFIPSLLAGNTHAFVVKVATVVFLWLIVIGASLIDLITGIRASHRTGQKKTTSWGIRRTLSKDLQYIATLTAMLLIDIVLSGISEHFTLFSIPLCSYMGTGAIVIIEALSIVENTRKGKDKDDDRIDDIQLLLTNTIDAIGSEKVKQILAAMQKQIEKKENKQDTK